MFSPNIGRLLFRLSSTEGIIYNYGIIPPFYICKPADVGI